MSSEKSENEELKQDFLTEEVVTPSEKSFESDVEVNLAPYVPENRSWKSYVWDSLDKTPEQRKTIGKVEFAVLFFATFSTLVKYLDKSNLTALYVSGMKEYLNVQGNELNYANTAYNVSSIICGYPVAWIMVRYNTKYLIIAIELLWTVTTFCTAIIKTPFQMIVVRCLLGIFECGHYASLMFVLGTYYTPEELARRSVILQSFTAIGPMFASYLQAGTATHLDGALGRRGFQWTFIIDGCISLFFIVPQIIFFPDILSRLKPNWYWTEQDIAYLRDRRPIKETPVTKFRLKDLKRIIFSWQVWAFWFFGFSQDIASLSNTSMSFYLKGWNKIQRGSYTVAQINNYVTPIYAVQYFWAIVTGWISDTYLRGQRWQPLIVAGLYSSIWLFILATRHDVFDAPRLLMFFCYYQGSVALGTAGLYWLMVQEYYDDDPLLRGIVASGMNQFGFTANCIFNPIFYKTTDQPNISTGHYLSAVFSILYAIDALILGYYVKYKKRRSTKQVQ